MLVYEAKSQATRMCKLVDRRVRVQVKECVNSAGPKRKEGLEGCSAKELVGLKKESVYTFELVL